MAWCNFENAIEVKTGLDYIGKQVLLNIIGQLPDGMWGKQ